MCMTRIVRFAIGSLRITKLPVLWFMPLLPGTAHHLSRFHTSLVDRDNRLTRNLLRWQRRDHVEIAFGFEWRQESGEGIDIEHGIFVGLPCEGEILAAVNDDMWLL